MLDPFMEKIGKCRLSGLICIILGLVMKGDA